MCDLTVIIPAYNAQATITAALSSLEPLQKSPYSAEIIVMDADDEVRCGVLAEMIGMTSRLGSDIAFIIIFIITKINLGFVPGYQS